jgi:chromosome segregation ATPase
MENTEITVSMKTAMAEHQHICECYRTAATAIVEMGRSLKNIRDYKLYIALGYESFKNYLESNGDYTFKERQAYTYIKLYEDNSTKFLKEHASIGVTKLELLSKLPEYEREEFADTHDLGGMTVEEVKKLIKEKQALGEQLTFLEEEKKEQTESAESLRAELEELRERLKQAEDKPIEVVKRDLDEEEIDKIRLSIRQELHAEHMKELNSLKKSSREAVAKYETALSKAKAEAEEADHAKAELEKKLKSGNADEARVALKIIFENVQKGLTEFIEKITDIEDPQTKEKFITVTSQWLRQAADDLEG